MKWRTPIGNLTLLSLTLGLVMGGHAGARAQSVVPKSSLPGSNVYSLNVVGYVNVSITNGYNFVADQFSDGTNTLDSILGTDNPAYADTAVFVWDVTNQLFLEPSWLDPDLLEWYPNYTVPVGQGFVVWSDAGVEWTLSFVGQVLQGSLANLVAGRHKLSLLASMVPISDNLSGTNFLFPNIDGADVYLFSTPSQGYADACTCFNGSGWFDPDHVADTNGPSLAVGQSFFVQNPAADTLWLRNFTVQFAPGPPASPKVGSTEAPVITSFSLQDGNAVLSFDTSAGQTYYIQFAPNALGVFRNVGTNAGSGSATLWIEPIRPGAQGYYRLMVSP